ncbi:putative carbonic anhydrase [Helianthus debilis subsp. tardiflorus]
MNELFFSMFYCFKTCQVRTVTREQLHAIREAVHDDAETNARPVQPLNNRWIKLYRPDDHLNK